MRTREFITLLDGSNPFFERFCSELRSEGIIAYRKGQDLHERVQQVIQARYLPLVDKRLRMVIGVLPGSHENMSYLLYAYHHSPEDEGAWLTKSETAATAYLADGMGYYISTMDPTTIVLGQRYREDRYDKDLFPFFQLNRTI